MDMQREVVVVSGVRTAIGDFGGGLKDVAPTELSAQVVREDLDGDRGARVVVPGQYDFAGRAAADRTEPGVPGGQGHRVSPVASRALRRRSSRTAARTARDQTG